MRLLEARGGVGEPVTNACHMDCPAFANSAICSFRASRKRTKGRCDLHRPPDNGSYAWPESYFKMRSFPLAVKGFTMPLRSTSPVTATLTSSPAGNIINALFSNVATT